MIQKIDHLLTALAEQYERDQKRAVTMIQKINHLLARSIVSLNAILAVALVVVGSIFGIAGMAFLGPLALIVGPVIGIAAAIAVCGVLAVLLDLRDILIEIRDALRADNGD